MTTTPPIPKSGFPSYINLDPNATAPTRGTGALTQATLAHGTAGLIIKLNRDSARHFAGREGTANISIPVAAVDTILFGIRQTGPRRACAEFALDVRYVTDSGTMITAEGDTNISAYGFEITESSHGDVRFLVPKPPCDAICEQLDSKKLPRPCEDELALLEWPSANGRFRLTFFDPKSTAYKNIRGHFDSEITNQNAVGGQDGACWLPSTLVP